MEEKRGENGCTHCQVLVELEEGSMPSMKRLVFGFLVFMMCVGVAWAGERGYRLLWAGTASSAQKCWRLFVRMGMIDGGSEVEAVSAAFAVVGWRQRETLAVISPASPESV